MKGTIKSLNERGFGFITVAGMEKDLFFHTSALVGLTFLDLKQGDELSFEIETASDGRQNAKNVNRV